MASTVSPQWQEKASDFFSNSGMKLKEASHNVVDAAEKVGSAVKSKWSLFQQPSTKHAMQERLLSAAASTSLFLRKGFSETKDKVVVGKVKVEEVAKKTAQRSKSLMSDIERWQKGVASTDVFGVPIEIVVKRQQLNSYTPHILVRCADFLISSGLNIQYLFKAEGDKKVIQQLVSLYNQEPKAPLPEDTNPLDVAALIKCYLASLPEPIITYELYEEICDRRSNINLMRSILKKLPNVNYMTLEFVTALLLRVSQKSLLNKMDVRSLSEEMAPVIIWKKGQRPVFYSQFWQHRKLNESRKNGDQLPSYNGWNVLGPYPFNLPLNPPLCAEEDGVDASSPIPLDDGQPIDFASIEVVQCLVQHHNTIFTDANETTWR